MSVLSVGRPEAAHGESIAKPALTEESVKAAFLVNFLQFVRWSPEVLPDGTPLELCVAAGPDFLKIVQPLALKASSGGGRQVDVRPVADENDLGTCHAVYLQKATGRRASDYLSHVREIGTLTVADIDGFTREGGTIQLQSTGRKAEFVVNLVAAKKSGLEVSARLLQLASSVLQ